MADKENRPSGKRKMPWWLWLVIGLLMVIGLAVTGFALFSPKKTSEVSVITEQTVPVITYGLESSVVFENDECAFLIDDIGEKGDYLELDVRCINKTEDVLSFTWNSTCINGSMFDPMWSVKVPGNLAMESSITFPLETLDNHNLIPAEEIKFVLSVFNVDQFAMLYKESMEYIYLNEFLEQSPYGDAEKDAAFMAQLLRNYKKIDGYSRYYFAKSVKVDKSGRPYYVRKDKTQVFFDEIYDINGQPVYQKDSEEKYYNSFYDDAFGRPYYFSELGTTIYYDGCGFAFSDQETGKNYFYDETGKAAYYGNYGIPEYYEETITQEQLDAGKAEKLELISSNHIVHKDFVIYPTGKSAGDITRPDRVSTAEEQIIWNGDKGNFFILEGELNPYKGLIIRTYVENNSDNYIHLGWENVIVNGEHILQSDGLNLVPYASTGWEDIITDGALTTPSPNAVLRPHTNSYRDIVVPAHILKELEIESVGQVAFRICAIGENLNVPLYPVTWEPEEPLEAPDE